MSGNRGRFQPEPDWRPWRRYSTTELPAAQRRWLLDNSSLTARLIGLGLGEFSVRRLSQSWQVPMASERRLLCAPDREVGLVREVILQLNESPVVFARSIFPNASLAGPLRHLRGLQNRSLGNILFQHPGLRRSQFELALLPPGSPYLPAELNQPNPVWARRSRFEIHGKAVLVSEVFLNTFQPWAGVLPVHRSQRGKVSTAFRRATQ